MSGSTFGHLFKVTTWGESHGPALGAVIDGCPAGLSLSCIDDIQPLLNRRKPGQHEVSSSRKEPDQVHILSGMFEGLTTGAPINLIIENEDFIKDDYDDIKNIYRPGHADYTYFSKYGVRDYYGGGRSSGRETAARVSAGAVAIKILTELGIQVHAFSRSIGPFESKATNINYLETNTNPLCMPDDDQFPLALDYVKECKKNGDSTGGVIECHISNLPAGIGEPVFDKLEAVLAHALLSIGAVRAFEVGDGFTCSMAKGSTFNDSILSVSPNGIKKESNHSGGITGGISDGSRITIRAHLKPTPSIQLMQSSITTTGETTNFSTPGRHDAVIVPRAVVVVEAMTAITLVDLLFEQMHAKMNLLVAFFQSSNS